MGKFNISLAEWMVNNLGEDALEKYWSNKNEVDPFKIGSGTREKVWMICQEKEYHDNYELAPYSFKKGRRCPYCRGFKVHPKDSFAQWGIDNLGNDFLEKYWDYQLNKNINPWKLSAHCAKKVYIKCIDKDYHNSYYVTISHFTEEKPTGCPYCVNHNGKVHPFDSLASTNPEAILLWSDKNEKSPFEYSPYSNKIVHWKCENGKHEDFKRNVNKSNIHEFRCPNCSSERVESILQEKVRIFLTEELGYEVKHEYYCELKCINPNTKYILPYDNEVIINDESKLIIEVHGKQHYDVNSFILAKSKNEGITTEEVLENIKWKDQFKMKFVLSQKGYYYLAIPYWTDNTKEEWKKLILEKLDEIKLL